MELTLKKYIKLLQALEKKHWDLPMITSSDDEGNSYHPVIFWPEVVYVEKLKHYIDTTYSEDDIEDQKDYIKVICLN